MYYEVQMYYIYGVFTNWGVLKLATIFSVHSGFQIFRLVVFFYLCIRKYFSDETNMLRLTIRVNYCLIM